MRFMFVTLGLAAMLCACASNTGVVPMGQDTYMVAKQAATGFPGLGNLKGEILQEANQFCTSKGKVIKVLSATETQPPYILGNYSRAEIQFACV